METLINGPETADTTFLFAHGAGAGMEHEFMAAIATGLGDNGIRVVRFEFPYMVKRREDGKKRPPDRQPRLLEAFADQVERLGDCNRLVIGGKSMGGRMATLMVSEGIASCGVDGIICLGFPFHPPGKPERFRGEHLQTIETPTLIIQGERDSFGNREELQGYEFSPAVHRHFLEDGDHSFKPRKKSGYSQAQHIDSAIRQMAAFINGL